METFFIADTHFNHDREFIYRVRGFNNIQEMNTAIINNWNNAISCNDQVYFLGDFFLGTDEEFILDTISGLNGEIHLILGNHDTNKKIELYRTIPKIKEIVYATKIVHNKREIMLSHYPMMTASLESDPKQATFGIHGHVHTVNKFYEGRPYMYNVSCDAQKCRPINIEDALAEMNEEIKKCFASVAD